jgi:LacI family transcriptional regulator
MIPGKDISIVGYDGIMLTSMMIPPLTTYEQDGVKMGNLMAENLIKKIENNQQENSKIIVSGRILKGGTVVDLK